MNTAVWAAAAAGLAGAVLAAGAAGAQQDGRDYRAGGHSNPAIDTRTISRIGDAAEAAFDPPYKVITFERPPGAHNRPVKDQYKNQFGVTFSEGLTFQLCEGQRYFAYDTQCTYRAAPSGRYAAVYRDEWNRPLRISFARPVCSMALAIYPTGGDEGEEFRVQLQPYTADGRRLQRATVPFSWTKDTVRWRLMAGAYMLADPAAYVDVSVESRKDRRKNVRFLIDDLAFIEEGCAEMLDEIAVADANLTPAAPRERRWRRDRDADETLAE